MTDGNKRVVTIELGRDFLREHDALAAANRNLLDQYGVTMIDVMGSVGAGKTSLIEALASCLGSELSMAVINGDLATTIDRDRILQHGVRAIQITTGRECHLDAGVIGTALAGLDLERLDLVVVENVGNLICPASFGLGAHRRMVVISVTEGPYVVVKHPHVFAGADWVTINKSDLAGAMNVDVAGLTAQLKDARRDVRVVVTSCRDGTGIADLAVLVREVAGSA